MDSAEQLRHIVAQLCDTPANQIGRSFALNSGQMQSSIRRAALAAAIRRRLNVNCPQIYKVTTFGELEAVVLGSGTQLPTVASTSKNAANSSLVLPKLGGHTVACGIDLEMVDALPAADDFWEHEFYKESFSRDEIAYCVLKENPRMHFAARWCAKEALIKCAPAFVNEKLANLELIHGSAGEVFMAHRVNDVAQRLPLAVSISHTNLLATAVVVRIAEE